MISADSPTCAARLEFRFDATTGVPPDAFSETGQDWGCRRGGPTASTHSRGCARAPAMAPYDGFRIDHLVGLYRGVRPVTVERRVVLEPASEPAQIALGETLTAPAGADTKPEVIAEDLGPSALRRESMTRWIFLAWALRWERTGIATT
jgi:4-alpha-glucanotransferase